MKRFTIAASLVIAVAVISAKTLTIEEQYADPFIRLASIAAQSENYEEAEVAAMQALKNNKNNIVAYDFIGAAREMRGDTIGAIKNFREGCKKAKGTDIEPHYLIRLSELLSSLGQTTEADDLLFKALGLDITDQDAAQAYYTLYQNGMMKNDTVQAIRFLENALALRPSINAIERISYSQRDLPSVRKYIEMAIENAGNDVQLSDMYVIRNYMFQQMGDTVKAADDIATAVALNSDNSFSVIENCLLPPKAILDGFDRAYRANPDDSPIPSYGLYVATDNALYQDALKWGIIADNMDSTAATKAAIAYCLTNLYNFPEAVSYFEKSGKFSRCSEMGYATAMTGDLKKGIAIMKDGTPFCSDSIEMQMKLATIEYADENYAEAIRLADEIQNAIDVPFLPALYLKGVANIRNGNIPAGKDILMKALEVAENENETQQNDVFLSWMPLIYHDLDRPDEAAKCAAVYESDGAMQPDPSSAYNLACYYALTGNTRKALDMISIAITGGEDPYWASLDPELKSLRSNPEFKRIISEGKSRIPGVSDK